MDPDARDRDFEVKEEDSGDTRMADDRPTYRSWKKKYRKMRIVFDQKMHEGEELHRLEQKALATARRLAVQKDRLLDLLLDVNNCAQIPPEKRFDLSLDLSSDADNSLSLDLDHPDYHFDGAPPAKSYRQLLEETPHARYASAAEHFPDLLADLEAGRDSPADPSQGQSHPPSFLTADEIDNYIYEIDTNLARKELDKTGVMPPLLPTLAPLATGSIAHHHPSTNPKDRDNTLLQSNNRDFALRNPTSVYNWLRKHAPKTFLQDGETHPDSNHKDHGDEHSVNNHTSHTSSGRGRGKGKRQQEQHSETPGVKGQRANAREKHAAAALAAAAVPADSVEFDDDSIMHDANASTPSAAAVGGKGKRKRVLDEDPGYRPKGGSSRPTKKKRKSESGGGVEGTPTSAPKRSRKSNGGERGGDRGGDD
ncbi:IEC3 subunit of the Ino80 complex, chromatin re-modelling-domain-containing protein [Bombardia bombarda]|uniref:IEC3 subunit of the Ino80 complex, chromatin re-modelling-domain-containing protein n=1 Tax=Bombardia bombarda TaxID=252184 RepID=A0AA39WGH9_9PEZI|nr:IEC3 subunit of the Ino80 complex, chromatin re-modelling-domain-containing protein [Bombardia bombarda]